MPDQSDDSSFLFGEGKPIIRNERVQGRIQWTLLGLIWFAFSMTYTSVTHCSFMRRGDPSKDYRELDQMGLFRVPYYDPFNHEMLGCVRYDSHSEWGKSFKLARANAIFLLISLSVVTIMYTLSMLFLWQERRKFILHWICRCLILAALLFNTLLFIVFGGDDCNGDDMKCPPGAGAILAIVNEFALFSMTVLCILVPPPTFPYFLRSSSAFPEGRNGMREGSIFSVPEIVKAKRVIEKEHQHPTKPKQQRPCSTHKFRHPRGSASTASLQTDAAQNDNKDDYAPTPQGNHRDGSSASTLVTDDFWDEEEGNPNHNYAQKYCAPSRSPGIRQCV
mmetsp:Transcript_6050/g.12133  ORF Transcript_6050/g.12133 Transcript_6050/m.12133 type:complete len:334 (-) Transcript_6050:23-1024(-)